MKNVMVTFETKNLTGEALSWAVNYANHLSVNGHHPINDDDRFYAQVHMENPLTNAPDLAEDFFLGMQFIQDQRICTYEKNDKWFAVHSDDISGDLCDETGEKAHGIIYEDDVISGDTMLEAGLRSYVFQVLGNNAELPEHLALENLALCEQREQKEMSRRNRRA